MEQPLRYECNQKNFNSIPGSPIGYWVSAGLISSFKKGTILNLMSQVRQGIIPGNVDAFLRLWHEVSIYKVGFNHKEYLDINRYSKKWFPYNKGGAFRRWYGNIEHLINMENNGYDIKNSGLNNNYRLREPDLYFKEAVTWSKVSSGTFSTRIMPVGNLFDIAGCCIFNLNDKLNYTLAFTNSNVVYKIMEFLSPTLNYEVDHIKKLPLLVDEKKKTDIDEMTEININTSKQDWDSFETSWDFKKHPLI